jgi:hypothetical protein
MSRFKNWCLLCKVTMIRRLIISIQLMTLHKVDTVIYQPRGSNVHRRVDKSVCTSCRSGGHCIDQLSYQRIWKMYRKQIKHNFHPKITLRMCLLIKQLITFHFGGHWFINLNDFHIWFVNGSQCTTQLVSYICLQLVPAVEWKQKCLSCF